MATFSRHAHCYDGRKTYRISFVYLRHSLLSLFCLFLFCLEGTAQQAHDEVDASHKVLKKRFIPVGQAGRGPGVLTNGGMYGTYQTEDTIGFFSPSLLVDGDYPGSIKFPGTNLSFLVGGMGHGDFFLDRNPVRTGDFITAAIPVPANEGYNTRISGRRSRLWLKAAFPSKNRGDVAGYIEFDFFNVPSGNQLEPIPKARLRVAVISFEGFVIGQWYTNFGDLYIWPLIINLGGPSSFAIGRRGYLSKKFHLETAVLEISAETPFSDLFFQEGFEAYTPSPDFVISYFHKFSWGHLRGAFLSRILGAVNSQDVSQRVLAYGWGANFTGKVDVTEKTYVVWQLAGGNGIGRSVTDGAVAGDLGGFQSAPNTISTIPAYALWASYTAFWNNYLYSTFLGGYVEYFPFSAMGGNSFQASSYGLVNLIFMPSNNFSLGVELNFGERTNLNEAAAASYRVSVVAQLTF